LSLDKSLRNKNVKVETHENLVLVLMLNVSKETNNHER
jgi:hypothetical protein